MRCLLVIVGVLSTAAGLTAQDKPVAVYYGNAKCPISGNDVDHRYYVSHQGQKIWTCSRECKRKVSEDVPGAFEKAYPKNKLADLRNEICPVSSRAAKAEHTVDFQGHRIRLCCDNCKPKFAKEPNKFVAIATIKDLKVVGNKMCPVMPEEEVIPDTFVRYQGKLIGVCCDLCPEEFAADPAKFMKALETPKK